MQGLTKQTEIIFRSLSLLPFTGEYTLIGGSALAMQINHRLSEDLDFCIWPKQLKKDKPVVDWPEIEKGLHTIGKITSRDVLGFDQVNFVLDGVKLTFLAKQFNLSPVKQPVQLLNYIKAADVEAIGAMKIELILRRTEFRDYYDIYSILRQGKELRNLIAVAAKYSNHLLKTRDALSFLSNGIHYRKEKGFDLLNPIYMVDSPEIEKFIKSLIQREYGLF
jgi:predicted nucleotidyltransferase component of viral defense system